MVVVTLEDLTDADSEMGLMCCVAILPIPFYVVCWCWKWWSDAILWTGLINFELSLLLFIFWFCCRACFLCEIFDFIVTTVWLSNQIHYRYCLKYSRTWLSLIWCATSNLSRLSEYMNYLKLLVFTCYSLLHKVGENSTLVPQLDCHRHMKLIASRLRSARMRSDRVP